LLPQQETSIERNRAPLLMASAIVWSIVGASNLVSLAGAMPVVIAALPVQCWMLGLSSI